MTWKTGAWGWHLLMADSFSMVSHLWWNTRKHNKPKISAWTCSVLGVLLRHNPSVVCNHFHYEKPHRYPNIDQPSSSAMGVCITLPEIISVSRPCVQNKIRSGWLQGWIAKIITKIEDLWSTNLSGTRWKSYLRQSIMLLREWKFRRRLLTIGTVSFWSIFDVKIMVKIVLSHSSV